MDGWRDTELQQKVQHDVVLYGVDNAGWALHGPSLVRSTLLLVIQHKDKLQTSH